MNRSLTESVKLSPTKSFGLLLILLLVGLFFTMLAQAGIAAAQVSQKVLLLAGSACQALLAFIFPAFAVAMISSSREGVQELGLRTLPKGVAFLSVMIIYFASLPAMNQIIEWNANMQFPDFMQGIAEQMQAWEDSAADLTDSLLSDTSVPGLILSILIIGCLTGFAEESFFRGGIQRILIRMKIGPHAAIWIAAIIFSAMHFQFFGFIPRMLLGALFGYMYYWTGSLWVSAFAHALNNSMAVITAWIDNNGYMSCDLDSIGVATGSFPYMALISLIVTALLLINHKRLFLKK